VKKQPYLFSRGRTYYYKRRVPLDLQPVFGSAVIMKSLGTNVRAEAIPKLAAYHAEVEIRFERMRSQRPISPEEIIAFAERHEAKIVSSLTTDWANMERSPEHEEHFEISALTAQDTFDKLKRASDEGDFSDVHANVDAIYRSLGLTISRRSGEYRTLCRAILEAEVRAYERVQKMDFGEAMKSAATTRHAVRDEIRGEDHTEALIAKERKKTPQHLIEEFIASNPSRAAKTNDELRTAIRMLSEVCGPERPVSAYRKRDATTFREALSQAPLRYRAHFPGVTLPEAIKLNAARPLTSRIDLMHSKTINDKWLSHVQSFFSWAVDKELIDANPFLKVRVRANRSDKAPPFSREDIEAMLNSPIYRGSKGVAKYRDMVTPGKEKVRDHHFWAPMVSLFTGARINEVGQLVASDVRKEEGIWIVRFTKRTDEGKLRPDTSLKSDYSTRDVPIHSQLIRMGFLELAKAQKDKTKRLFPAWRANPKYGKFANGAYGHFLNRQFLPSLGAKTRRLRFHSFRHTFSTELNRQGVPERVASILMGHSAGGSSMTSYYIQPSLTDLHSAVEKVSYWGLDFSHLYPDDSRP
jgi:integrase